MREGRNSSVKEVDKERLDELKSQVLHLNNLAGTFYPLDASSDSFAVDHQPDPSRFGVLPESLWHGYGTNEAEYLAGGKFHAKVFYDVYKKYNPPLSAGQRMLDFGCAAGRILRFFDREAAEAVEVWGCDIDAASIEWCQKNLMPPLKFLTNTTQASLPFPEKHFDFMYAGSVSSHMNELTTAWLLELARLTARGGICVLTIHSELTWDYINKNINDPKHHYGRQVRFLSSLGLSRDTLIEQGRQCFLFSPWWVSAWFSTEYFCRLASLGFDVVDVLPGLYGDQTGIVLRGR